MVRVEAITREFMRRLDNTKVEISRLYMWSLGTSMKDSKYNRKLLLKRWRLFDMQLQRDKRWEPVFRVVEAGRRGYLHIHVINPYYYPHKVLLKVWRGLTHEKSNVHVSSHGNQPEPRLLAKYLMKYLTKESSSYRWMGSFYGKGQLRNASSNSGERKEPLLYGGICYGGFYAEARKEKKKQQAL